MLARAGVMPGMLVDVPPPRRAASIAASVLLTGVLVSLDIALPDVALAPLLIVPVALLSYALGVPALIGACLALGFIGVAADAWPKQLVDDPWRYVSALALGISYVIVAALFRFAVATWQRHAALDGALGDAQRTALAAFAGRLPSAHGWKLETIVVPGERPVPCVACAFDGTHGLEVIVAATEGGDIGAAMALAALRAALPEGGVHDARRWLHKAHTRMRRLMRHTGAGCTAWAARLSVDGDVRFASAGFSPVAIVRTEGVYRAAGGGGRALGLDETPTILEGFSRFDSGDVLVVADPGLAALLRRDAMLLWSLLAGSNTARDAAAAHMQGAGGLVLVARRVRGRDESDLEFAARLLERLSQTNPT